MIGYILYGEVTERGSRKFLNVVASRTQNGIAMCKRTDQKKFYRQNIHFSEEEFFLAQNPEKLQELLEGKTIYL